MKTVNSESLQSVMPDNMRIEVRQVTGDNPINKIGFGEKIKMAMLKVGGGVARLAQKVLPFFGPLGMLGSSVAYGMGRLTEGAANRIMQKRANQANLDASAASMGQMIPNTPGFQSFGGGSSDQSLQVAPFARGYEKEIVQTLNSKGDAASQSIDGFKI